MPTPGGRPDPAVALFLAVVVLGAVQAAVLGDARRTLLAAVPALVGAGAVALGQRLRVGADDHRGRAWLRAIAVGEVALAVWVLVAFLRALPGGIGEPSGFYVVKLGVTTPLGDHNTAAGLLLVGVVATVVLVGEDRRWWLATAVVTAGLVATLSRGGALVLVAVGLLAARLRSRGRLAVTLVVLGVAATGAVVASAAALGAAPPTGAEVADGPVGPSVLARADLVRRGVEVAADHPLLGVGLGGFVDHAQDLPPPNDHAHNVFAHAAAEGGVVRLAVVVSLVALLVVRGRRASSAWRREVVLLGGAALVLHAQIDVLGGLLGAELLLAAVLALGGRSRRGPRAEAGGYG